MSDSTNAQSKAVVDTKSEFEKELLKKIRNKTKKIENIKQLEKKIKTENIKPNEEQVEKIASRAIVEAEIAEIKSYLDLYTQTTSE